MSWGSLSFLAEPWFVLPWYAIGVLGAVAVAYDLRVHNTPLKEAMKWAWPIIVLFFSVIGIALYLTTARAPAIGRLDGEKAKKAAHREYERNELRRVNGAVIHCVAGDGLGIMTGMVIARATGMSFWQEFWFEYAVGFVFGWFIFQYKSMTHMADSRGRALWMAFRGEFFSMMTVMAGMGVVMGYVTPLAATAQPKPLTYAFWGFGMLGLLVGYAFTFPMNWLMVKVGWKHGMGSMEDTPVVEGRRPRYGLVAAMCALGALALAVPATLVESRDGTPVSRASAPGTDAGTGLAMLDRGLSSALDVAVEGLRQDRRSEASHAIDAALRAASVGAIESWRFQDHLRAIRKAKHELHMGREGAAVAELARVADRPAGAALPQPDSTPGLDAYRGATVVDAHGVVIGEVVDIDEDRKLHLALDGIRDVFGFLDLAAERTVRVEPARLVFGPTRALGRTLLAFPEPDAAASERGTVAGR